MITDYFATQGGNMKIDVKPWIRSAIELALSGVGFIIFIAVILALKCVFDPA